MRARFLYIEFGVAQIVEISKVSCRSCQNQLPWNGQGDAAMKTEKRSGPRIVSFGELSGYLREDYATNDRKGTWTFWTPGFQAAAVYRLGVWCNCIRPRVFRAPLRLAIGLVNFFVRNFYGTEIYPTANIGRRLRIAHQHGIVIHSRAEIGDDCLLRQGVTIGADGRNLAAPQLGNRVKIGAGAVIAGPIIVGDDVTIGPNAVVMTNVPHGSIVASPQSRIMSPPPRRKGAEQNPVGQANVAHEEKRGAEL